MTDGSVIRWQLTVTYQKGMYYSTKREVSATAREWILRLKGSIHVICQKNAPWSWMRLLITWFEHMLCLQLLLLLISLLIASKSWGHFPLLGLLVSSLPHQNLLKRITCQLLLVPVFQAHSLSWNLDVLMNLERTLMWR